MLLPYAKEKIEKVSSSLRYFTIDGEDSFDYDVCNDEGCIAKMHAQLIEEYPHSSIESKYSAGDSDHEVLSSCAICGRPLNTQLTWVEYTVDCFLDDKEEWSKELFISNAFRLYCVYDALPSIDYNPSEWDKKQYHKGNTRSIDLRTEFYEKIMELADSIITQLTL